jgi:hypothetical protein
MVSRLRIAGAATIAEACLVACASPSETTAKVVTMDGREGGLVVPDVRVNPSFVEPAPCAAIPPDDDVGCPHAEFPSGPCTTPGQSCLSTPFEVGVRALYTCEVNPDDPMKPPTWTREAYFYDPGGIPPLPELRTLDTSDCASRPVIACACGAGETAENAIEQNPSISRCQATNPIVFLTFTDAGCPIRAQYDETTWADDDFDSCLTEALSVVRFDCATSVTRVVLMTRSKD